MVDVVSHADTIKYNLKARCPYDTGNLRNNGIGEVSSITISQATVRINETDAAPYAAILNEAPIINYFGKHPHVNRHYRWIDNIIEPTVERIERILNRTGHAK